MARNSFLGKAGGETPPPEHVGVQRRNRSRSQSLVSHCLLLGTTLLGSCRPGGILTMIELADGAGN